LDAVVTLATGGYSANRLVSTLRDPARGAWTGHIFVLTDDTSQYHGSSSTNQFGAVVRTGAVGIDIAGAATAPVFENEHDADKWHRFLTAPGTHTHINSKWQKTQVFHRVPPEVNTLLFMDADIEVQNPLADFEIDLISHHTRQVTPMLLSSVRRFLVCNGWFGEGVFGVSCFASLTSCTLMFSQQRRSQKAAALAATQHQPNFPLTQWIGLLQPHCHTI
jgi:hypothetical protein